MHSKVTVLDRDQEEALHDWIQFNRDAPNQPPLTLLRIREHILEAFDIKLSKEATSSWLKQNNWEWTNPGSGYVANRRRLPSTLDHLEVLLPICEFVEEHDNFVVVYVDESKPNTAKVPSRLWTRRPTHATQEERLDKRRKVVGGGMLYVFGGVCKEVGGFVQDVDGNHIGRMEGTTGSAETAVMFGEMVTEIVDRLKELHSDKTIVVIADCPSWHRAITGTRNTRAQGMSLAALELEMRRDGTWKAGLDLAAAREAFSGSAAEYSRLLDNIADIEAVLYARGAVIIFNANSQAMFNTIERYWRVANRAFEDKGDRKSVV